ncbi:hypothetical protein N9335_01505 [Crocinitomicaceae bacterium]|nr:hypothetical protein [Crocinitomicaceae bacterium]
MNAAQVHLLSNHLPLTIPFIGLIVLLVSIFVKSDIVRRTGYFILFLGGLFTIPTFFSGEGAEEIVEHLGKSHVLIHEHEESAETFAYLNYLLALLSVGALWMNWKKIEFEKYLLPVVIGIGVLVCVFALSTGKSGGEISHSKEIHSEH